MSSGTNLLVCILHDDGVWREVEDLTWAARRRSGPVDDARTVLHRRYEADECRDGPAAKNDVSSILPVEGQVSVRGVGGL